MAKQMNQAVEMPPLDTEATVAVLNRILHFELNGVMQQYHHLWMSRWLQASRTRAISVGEHIAALSGGTSVGVDKLMKEAVVSADAMLDEARAHQKRRLEEYQKLLELVAGRHPALEAFARAQIAVEETHISGVTLNDA
jgi:bacterioferritin